METVIGLGSAGCNIADYFAQYPQYKVYKIDNGIYGKGCYFLPKYDTPEEYEAHVDDMSNFLGSVSEEVLFILGGSGNVSGAALRILQQLRHCKINILYIEPDIDTLSGKRRLQERVTFYVLQEYARSGLFERLYLVSNPQLENILGDVPIIGYNDKLNNLVASTFHMINVYTNNDPIVKNYSEHRENTRISTIGISTLENEKNLFFFLDNVKEMRYYYAINRKKLETDGTLMRKITENVKKEKDIDVSYGVYATDYPDDYVYCVANTSMIQYRENEKKALQTENQLV
tara:strand:+ start:61 stop:924 length:864 start_codon:yes stop_codon:yes gene_type:complete